MFNADVEIKHLLWCKDQKSDKIWGVLRVEERLYAFWGARGKKVSFKFHGDAGSPWTNRDLLRLKHVKSTKGYREVKPEDLPVDFDLVEKIKRTLATDRMLGKVRSETF